MRIPVREKRISKKRIKIVLILELKPVSIGNIITICHSERSEESPSFTESYAFFTV